MTRYKRPRHLQREQAKSTNSDEVTVVFNDFLRETYQELHDEFVKAGISRDTCDMLKLFADGTPVELPTAFAIMNDIAVQGTQYAMKNKDSNVLMLLLDAQSALSAADKDTIHLARDRSPRMR